LLWAPSNLIRYLVLALNDGMRDSEIKRLTWNQIDWDKKILTVGRSKSEAGTGGDVRFFVGGGSPSRLV
jgi:integrase